MWNHKKPFWILDARAHNDRVAAPTAEEAELVNEQLRLWRLLDEWDVPPVGANFDAALYQRIEESQRRPWLARWFDSVRFTHPRPALGFALATLVVIAGLAFDQSRTFHAHRPLPRNSGISLIDADQLENSLDDLQLLHQVYAEPGVVSKSM